MDTPRGIEGQRRITVDQWDVDGWNMLAAEANRATFEKAKPIHERLTSQFPPISKFWRSYSDHLITNNNDTGSNEDIIQLYDRAVKQAPTSIDLWQSYISYMIQLQQKNPGLMESKVLDVLEKAISSAGLDLKADIIWTQCINFIERQAAMTDEQRKDDLRRIYQRAVRNPMDQLDVFWRRYVEFENENAGNKDATRAVISELQSKNHEARMEFRARSNRKQGMTSHSLPVPPRSRSKDISLAQSWRRFIAWEIGNHANVSAIDVHARVIHAFESALVPLYRYAEFWIEYVGYLYNYVSTLKSKDPNYNNNQSNAGANGKNNSKANNINDMNNNKNDANSKDNKNSNDNNNNNRDNSIIKAEVTKLEDVLERSILALPDSVAMHVYVNNVYVKLGKADKGVSTLETLTQKHPSPLAYIHLMRATWKHEGRDAARKTFARGRKDKKAAHPTIYSAAAMMEFSISKESKIPRNVFEFGLKNFPKNASLTLDFVNWLCGTNDTEYARVILKKVLPDAKGSDLEVKKLWEKWIEVEELVGDTTSVENVINLWKENGGIGREQIQYGFDHSNFVIHDVLRMSRFQTTEGVNDDELAVIGLGKDHLLDSNQNGSSGGGNNPGLGLTGTGTIGNNNNNNNNSNNGNNNSNTNNSGGSAAAGGGKRDPRTGRRVDRSGNTGGGKAKDSGMNGFMGRRKGMGGLDGDDGVMRMATTWLENMASTLPPYMDGRLPHEDASAVMRIIMDTPDSFTDTPAGRSNSMYSHRHMTGKKRKGEELHPHHNMNVNMVNANMNMNNMSNMSNMGNMNVNMNMNMNMNMNAMSTGMMAGNPIHAPSMQQDVFRARQAAKQSRLR